MANKKGRASQYVRRWQSSGMHSPWAPGKKIRLYHTETLSGLPLQHNMPAFPELFMLQKPQEILKSKYLQNISSVADLSDPMTHFGESIGPFPSH